MSPQWQGNLSNTNVDLSLDNLLASLLVTAYATQDERITIQASVAGISPYFVLGTVLLGHAQLSQALLLAAYAYPGDRPHQPVLQQIAHGTLKGWRALGGLWGLLHIGMQWGYAVVLLVRFSMFYPERGWTIYILNAVAIAYAAVLLLPVAYLTLRRRPTYNHDMGSDIVIGFASIVTQYTAPVIIVVQFTSQLLEMRHSDGTLGALSRNSLGAQALVVAGMGKRWRQRLGRPAWDNHERPAHPPLWYRLEMLWAQYQWGMVWMNQLFYAGGCAVLWMSAMLK